MSETAKRWVLGLCWLCRQTAPVTFIGPIQVNGISAPGFACRSCCDWSLAYVQQWTHQYDTRAAS